MNKFLLNSRNLIIGAVVLLIIGASVYFVSASYGLEKTDGYQAVFLTNGQVYFGKITSFDDDYLELIDVFYLQIKGGLQDKAGEEKEEDLSLVKLGSELHGPEDRMFINYEQILFYENLKKDSKVVSAIDNYQTNK
ncbi:hypothetical protein KKA94_00235 [Patescibacteria group bacterium]|nr:hypothetical protein [Patescibacteria group bacterium]